MCNQYCPNVYDVWTTFGRCFIDVVCSLGTNILHMWLMLCVHWVQTSYTCYWCCVFTRYKHITHVRNTAWRNVYLIWRSTVWVLNVQTYQYTCAVWSYTLSLTLHGSVTEMDSLIGLWQEQWTLDISKSKFIANYWYLKVIVHCKLLISQSQNSLQATDLTVPLLSCPQSFMNSLICFFSVFPDIIVLP